MAHLQNQLAEKHLGFAHGKTTFFDSLTSILSKLVLVPLSIGLG